MPKSLLVADDSLTIRKVIGMIFATEDFEITSVDNGLEAISKARELRPDLVLADVTMPGRSGYEVCEAIKANPDTQSMPVLLLAGTFEPFDENRARAVKADDYIVKPFESRALLEKVRTLTGAPRPAETPRQVFTPESSVSAARPSAPRVAPAPGAFPPSSTSFPTGGPPRPSAPAYSLGVAGPTRPSGASPAQARPLPPPSIGQAALSRPPPNRIPTPGYINSGSPLPPQRPVAVGATRPPAGIGAVAGAGLGAPAYPYRPPPTGQSTRGAPAPGQAGGIRPGPAPLPVAITPGQAPGQSIPASRSQPQAAMGNYEVLREALSKASREVIERVVWEVVPQLAETIVREHLDQLVKNREGKN